MKSCQFNDFILILPFLCKDKFLYIFPVWTRWLRLLFREIPVFLV